MAKRLRTRSAQLTLVGAASAESTRNAGGLDWSKLMALAQDGDRQAYRTLLQDVTPYLRSIAARCFKQPSEVEDAVQDVLLTIHTVRHAYDPSRPFGPWLVAIANRRFIDRLRRETRVKAREIALSTEHETFPESQTNLDYEASEEAALAVGATKREVLDLLVDTGLIEPAENRYYRLHRVIADYAWYHLEEKEAPQRRLVEYMNQMCVDHATNMALLEREYSTLAVGIEIAEALKMHDALLRGVLTLIPYMRMRGLLET